MGPHKNGTWTLAEKTYWTAQKWHMSDYYKDMGLNKNGLWVFAEKTYGTTQKWHLSACEKGIWDYTKLAHECSWKKHMGLHEIDTWTIAFYYSQEILETMSNILPCKFFASQ